MTPAYLVTDYQVRREWSYSRPSSYCSGDLSYFCVGCNCLDNKLTCLRCLGYLAFAKQVFERSGGACQIMYPLSFPLTPSRCACYCKSTHVGPRWICLLAYTNHTHGPIVAIQTKEAWRTQLRSSSQIACSAWFQSRSLQFRHQWHMSRVGSSEHYNKRWVCIPYEIYTT